MLTQTPSLIPTPKSCVGMIGLWSFKPVVRNGNHSAPTNAVNGDKKMSSRKIGMA